MSAVFIEILNMSFTAGIVACAVILARLPLKKAPKIFSYALWAVVLFRLVCPFTIESAVSLMPGSPKPVPQSIVTTHAPAIKSNIAPVDNAVNFYLATNVPNDKDADDPPAMLGIMDLGAFIWLLGAAVLFGYALLRYLKLKRGLKIAAKVRDNIYETDRIATPFVLGFIRPKIYLPIGIEDADYILKHEQTHIRRLDYLIKPAAFLALCLHWFNPVIWLSYYLCCKDMEMSCDESVLKHSESDIRGKYSGSLLSLSVKQNGLLSPLAFGESNTKTRIKNVLGYKKPTFWISVLAVIAVLGMTVGFAANRVQETLPWDGVAVRSDWLEEKMHFNRITFGSDRDYVEPRMGEPDYSDASMVHYYNAPVLRRSETGMMIELPDSDYDVTIYFDDPTIIEKKGLRGVYRIDVIGIGEQVGVNGEDAGMLASVLREYGGPNKVERNGNIYKLWYYSPHDSDKRMWFEVENGELNRHMGIVCVCDGSGISAKEAVELLSGSVTEAGGQILFQIPAQYYKPHDWNIHIAGRAEYDDGMSMSVHEFEDVNDAHAWEAGKWYSIQLEGRNLTELTMDIFLPGENGGTAKGFVDLLAFVRNLGTIENEGGILIEDDRAIYVIGGKAVHMTIDGYNAWVAAGENDADVYDYAECVIYTPIGKGPDERMYMRIDDYKAWAAVGENDTDVYDFAEKLSALDLDNTPIDEIPDNSYLWPLTEYENISAQFVTRKHPIEKTTVSHDGIDISAPTGTPILAAKAGTVIEAGENSVDGLYVLLDHGAGMQTFYAHMNEQAEGLANGDSVDKGDIIGYVGSTGESTGSHLHFGISIDGVYINPLEGLN